MVFFASPPDCQDEVLVQLLRTWGINVDNWVPLENPAKAKTAAAPTATKCLPAAPPQAQSLPAAPAAPPQAKVLPAAPAAPPQAKVLPAAPAAPPHAKVAPAAPAAPPQPKVVPAAVPVKVESQPAPPKGAAQPEKNLLELHVTRMHLQEMNLGVMMMIFPL